jgi:hypothetical protein
MSNKLPQQINHKRWRMFFEEILQMEMTIISAQLYAKKKMTPASTACYQRRGAFVSPKPTKRKQGAEGCERHQMRLCSIVHLDEACG